MIGTQRTRGDTQSVGSDAQEGQQAQEEALEGGQQTAALAWISEKKIALEGAAEKFSDEGIETLEDLAMLDDDMLKELGVKRMGDRAKFKALRQERERAATQAQVAVPVESNSAQQGQAAPEGGASSEGQAVSDSAENQQPEGSIATVKDDSDNDEEEDKEGDDDGAAPAAGRVPSFASFLKKRGNIGFVGQRAWLKRHFRLYDDDAMLFYHKNDKVPKEIGRINLKGVLLAEKTKKKGGFAITMKTKARVYDLQAEKDELRDEWLSRISKHLVDYTPPEDEGADVAAKGAAAGNDESAKELRKSMKFAAATVAAATPVHRSEETIKEKYASTLAETNELPASLSTRFAAPESLATAAHPLHGKADSSSLTIFSGNGTALVSEIRHVKLDDASTCVVGQLPRDADGTSFSVQSLTDESVSALDLTYRVDPKTPEELLLKSAGEGMTVGLPRRGNDAGFGLSGDGATSLSLKGTVLYNRDEDDRFVLGPSPGEKGTFHFLSTKDVVSWTPDEEKAFDDGHLRAKFDADAAAEHDLRLVYCLNKNNFKWHAAYQMVLDHTEKNAAFSGSIVVHNKSGRSWNDETSLVFVASPDEDSDDEGIETEGKTETEQAAETTAKVGGGFGGALGGLASMAGSLVGAKPTEKAVPRTRTYVPAFHSAHALPDDRETQLVIADVGKLAVASMDLIQFKTPKFVTRPQKAPTYGVGKDSGSGEAKTVVEFINHGADGKVAHNTLGNMALPAGSVVVSRTRADGHGTDLLTREAKIPHTDVGSSVIVELEKLEGVSATREQTGFVYDDERDFVIESFEIKVSNGRDEPVVVTVEESMYRWKHWETTHSSHEVLPHPNPLSKRVVRWLVSLPPGESDTIVYTVFYNRFPPEDD